MNYYVVGANWSGEKQHEDFYRRGYWEMGYDDSEQPRFAEMRDSMQPGDRIAIKSMDGQGATTITIHAIGIVKEVFHKRVYIDWVFFPKPTRHVPSRGCLKTIHGPFKSDDSWVHEVFCI